MDTDDEREAKFYFWTESKLKGTMAETIIQQLLEYSGYSVYRFGQERFMQNLHDMKLKDNPIRKIIRFLPDFIAIDKEGNAHLIEIKYRAKESNWKRDNKLQFLGKTWGESLIIFVSLSKPHFRIAKIKDFLRTDKLIPLEEDDVIKIDTTLLKRYENLVLEYFTGK